MKTKNNPHRELCNEDVLNLSADVIEDMLNLNSASNTTYSDKDIVHHLLNASTSQSSVNTVSNLCYDAPCEGTIRNRLKNLKCETLQHNLNEKLKIHGCETISGKKCELAADFTNIPYYEEEENPNDTIKTKPKQGTSRFFAYASIYLILNNKRYTLAVKYVKKGDKLKDVIDFLINEIRSKGFKIKALYLDKEFFTVAVIDYLISNDISFIIPCVPRGPSGGIRNLFVGKKSYTTEYTMHSKEDEVTFQVNVVVKYSKDKFKKKGVRYFAYAVYNMDIPVKSTFKKYRKRFGIESSYRLMNQARARTTSKNPALKLLYLGLGLLLTNIWVYIQWKYLSIPRKGGRRKVTWTLQTMLRQIARATEDKLGFSTKIPIKI